MKTIETKITKTGKLTVKIDGNRAKLQDAIDAVLESDIDSNVIVIKNHLGDIFTGGFSFENRYMNFVFNHTFSSNPDKVTGTYAFNMSQVVVEKIANHQFAEYKISEPIAEANPSEYAITPEAMDIATNAEIENANSEAQTSTPVIDIADYNTMMTWAEKVSNGQRDAVTPIKTYLSKLGYTADKQDVFNAIDTDDLNGFRRYISQFPFLVKDDAGYIQKLYVQEDGQVVLAEIPTSEYPSTENNAPEFRYYIKSRRPIAGAVPKGYISATAGEMRAYSLCTDGSVSRVPRKVVFGVAVYDHPLSDEQIINYDSHVDPRNPNLNTETQEDTSGEPDEPKFETGKTYYIKGGDSYYTLKVDARTDKMLTGTTPHGTCKYHIHDTFRGEYIRTHLYDDCGNREMIWAAYEYKEPATDVNKVETQTTKQAEFYADKIRRESKSYGECDIFLPPDSDVEEEDDELIDPPVDNTLTADIAKYQAAFDTARQISIRAGSGVCKINGEEIWFNYGNLRSISSDNYRAEITLNNGRKRFRYRGMVTKRADFLDRMSNEIVATEQKEIFGKFYDTYQMPDTELDPNADYFQIRIFPKFANGTENSFHATANDFNRALELINQFKTLDLPFIGLIKRNTVCGEEYYRHNRDGSETINPPEPPKPTEHTADKEPYRPFTAEDTIESLNHSINWAKDTLATMTGDTYTDDIGEEWTRSELETAITDWEAERDDLIAKARKKIRDSLNRAIKQCVKKRIAYLKCHNSQMEKHEYELMHLLQGARRELEAA